MTVEERIQQFGENNPPFYLCDHENGKYSLCLPLNFLSGPFENYGQEAFNRYALSVGDPVKSNGFSRMAADMNGKQYSEKSSSRNRGCRKLISTAKQAAFSATVTT